MTDIVERLRAQYRRSVLNVWRCDERLPPPTSAITVQEAAEIERLRAENIDWSRQNLQNVRNEVNRDVNAALVADNEHLRGILLVAHGTLMKATGGDMEGKYENEVWQIRSALGWRKKP